jgi:hypothetical protein
VTTPASNGPAIICPTCSEPIDLASVQLFGQHRLFVCGHCHHREVWLIDDSPAAPDDVAETVWADVVNRIDQTR